MFLRAQLLGESLTNHPHLTLPIQLNYLFTFSSLFLYNSNILGSARVRSSVLPKNVSGQMKIRAENLRKVLEVLLILSPKDSIFFVERLNPKRRMVINTATLDNNSLVS